jgi:hypothetical protein
MAAKLKVNTKGVWLGALRLASFRASDARGLEITNYVLGDGSNQKSARYDSSDDCVQDCESEVRRLLNAAGVEVQ